MAKKKKETFSVAKAVRANARDRVGQPKPARVIAEKVPEGKRESKYRETLSGLLGKREE